MYELGDDEVVHHDERVECGDDEVEGGGGSVLGGGEGLGYSIYWWNTFRFSGSLLQLSKIMTPARDHCLYCKIIV